MTADAAGRRPMSRRRKLLLWLVGLFAVYSAVGFWGVPAACRYLLAVKVAETLHRPLTVGPIRFNPYTLTLNVRDFSMADRQEGGAPFLGFGRLRIDLEAASLFKRALIVRAVRLERPTVSLIRFADLSYNFSDLLTDTAPPAEAEPGAERQGLRFSINNIELVGGAVEFQDRPKGISHRITDIRVALPFVANLAHLVEIYVQPSLAATVNGTPMAFTGRTKPFTASRETELDIRFTGLDLPRYLAYLPPDIGFGLRSGQLDADLTLGFVQQQERAPKLTVDGRLTLHRIALTDTGGGDLFTLSRGAVEIAPSDLVGRELHLAAVELASPHLTLRRLEDGHLNLLPILAGGAAGERQTNAITPPAEEKTPATGRLQIDTIAVSDALLRAPAAAETAREIVTLPSLTVTGTTVGLGERQVTVAGIASNDAAILIERRADGSMLWQEFTRPATAESPPPERDDAVGWTVALEQLALSGYTVTWADEAAPAPASLTLTDIDLAVSGLSTAAAASPAAVELSCRMAPKGTIRVAGGLVLQPSSAELEIAVNGLALGPFYPYLADRLDLLIANGTLSATGRLRLAPAAGPAPLVRFQGSTGVDDLEIREPRKAEPLLAWQALKLAGIDLRVSPTALRIDTVTLERPAVHLAVDESGSLNLKAVLRQPVAAASEAESAPAAATTDSAAVQIDAIRCQGGTVTFADKSITPAFQTSLEEVNGSVTGLSSLADKPARVELDASLDRHSPLAVSGSVKPLGDRPSADLAIRFDDIEMSGLSPYSGRYIGYRLDKGKLFLDLGYRVEGSRLDAQNRIFMDQLALGAEVESPEALDLPIRLAIALLQNRAGEIRLNVPVSGDLTDPQFSLASTIASVFVNLITKAITSPFAVLGALVGGGEELQYIDFPAGLAALPPASTDRLEKLATVLADRPRLRLEITGQADGLSDRAALHGIFFMRLLKAEKLKAMIRRGTTPAPAVDAVELAPEEYEEYLTRAYKAADFKRPRNFLGFLKKQPPEVMEELLKEHIAITDSDLASLARERSAAVKAFLIEHGGIAADRLFLLDPKLGAADQGGDEASRRRVELAVR